jgi:hypothetical protein
MELFHPVLLLEAQSKPDSFDYYFITQDFGSPVLAVISPNFPAFPLVEVIPQYLEQSKTIGRNATIKAFRNWVRERLQQ